MRREFEQGKRIVTVVISIILLINGLGLWLSRTLLLTWYGELHASLEDPAAIQAARTLRDWFIANQQSFLSNQAANYAVVILFCLLLFIGFDWLRMLWAAHWLLRGLLGIVASLFFFYWLGHFHIIFILGLVTALLYISCGVLMLLSPSVKIYMYSLRPSYGKRR